MTGYAMGPQPSRRFRCILAAAAVVLLLTDGTAFAHGGKSHAGGNFTPLQALQKATTLYDKLIVDGKLEESWETDLKDVSVQMRRKDDKTEYRVGFKRKTGSPDTVYIFFTLDGQYAGSNFEGD